MRHAPFLYLSPHSSISRVHLATRHNELLLHRRNLNRRPKTPLHIHPSHPRSGSTRRKPRRRRIHPFPFYKRRSYPATNPHSGMNDKQITPHTPLPLPLWLAELLCVQTTRSSSSSSSSPTSILTIDLPPLLSARVLNALRADPISVELRQQAPYFYAFATRVLELFEEEDVVDVLEMSWKRRSKGVGDVAHASSGGGGGAGGVGEREAFLRGLEEGERACKFYFSLSGVVD